LSKLVEEELRKIHSQIDLNTKLNDKRFEALQKSMDVEKFQKHLEKKISKEEVYVRLTALDTRVNKIEASMKSDT
jgi:hypothetical protein